MSAELSFKDYRERFSSLDLAEYKKHIDAHFQRGPIASPNRLSPLYFNPDGSGKPILTDLAGNVQRFWPSIAREEKFLSLYVVGSHANGRFQPHSDLDVVIHFEGEYQNRGILGDKMRKRVDGETSFRCTRKDLHRSLKAGRVDIGMLDVKPFGPLYDIITSEWVSFGKTVGDYLMFQWRVFGIE